jgi:alanine racemase
MSAIDRATSLLTIDLDAVAANFRLLKGKLGGRDCAVAVKADAYGLGAVQVAPALARAGATTFFTITLDEALEIRPLLPKAEIFVLYSVPPGAEAECERHGFAPVLNTLGDVERWGRFCRQIGRPLPAALHLDTGMNRLGLSPAEAETLVAEPDRLDGIGLSLVMSHLACADEPDHALNRLQLSRFQGLSRRLPAARRSLANSAGCFLGPDYRFDLGRPGASLYGLAPLRNQINPMAQPVRLQAKILQVRDVDTPETVGYGATHRIAGPRRLATVAAGYADGYLRSLSSRGVVHLGDRPANLVGRVSMDLITLDVTDLPRDEAVPGAFVDLIGPHNTADDVAAAAGTIGNEILTSLGRRYLRRYVGTGA